MASAYDTLFRWARKTTTSFVELCALPAPEEPPASCPGDTLVYRLRHWPTLAPTQRTAEVYRALSLMSNRPVNRTWFLRHSKLKARQLDRLLEGLIDQGAVEVLDVSSYSRG